MSGRSGYSDLCPRVDLYQRAVENAINGKRGQRFVREAIAALDALPEPKLVADELTDGRGGYCLLGAVGRARGVEDRKLRALEDERPSYVAQELGLDIAGSLAAEIVNENDADWFGPETDAQRFARVRRWLAGHVRGSSAKP